MRTTLTGAVVALAMVVSACSFGTSPESTTSSSPLGSSTTATSTAQTTTTTNLDTTTSASVSSNVDPAMLEAIDDLILITEQVRGLRFLEPPTVTVVSEEELAERVRALIEEELDPEETAQSEALFKVLGILDPDTDLGGLYTDLYTEQVAGYYDGDTKEMVIPSGQELSGLQKLTVVHELTHALTDQHFGFHGMSEELDLNEQYEEAAAFQALIEGDASWAELIYFQSVIDADEQAAIVDESMAIETGVLERTPNFVRDLLVFPYDFEGGGASFVADLWLVDRSFAPVDEAYQNPPTTTEQIVDPERYRSGESAIDVQLPDTSLDGYEIVDEGIWGQVGFEFLFDQELSTEESARASVGWGGDEYRVLWDGAHVVFVVEFVGDTPEDTAEMAEVLADFIDAQIPSTSSTFLGVSDQAVVFVASDGEDAESFAQANFPGF